MARLRLRQLTFENDAIIVPSYTLENWCCRCENKMAIGCVEDLGSTEGLSEFVCVKPQEIDTTSLCGIEVPNVLFATLRLFTDKIYRNNISDSEICTIPILDFSDLLPDSVNIIVSKLDDLSYDNELQGSITYEGSFAIRSQIIRLRVDITCDRDTILDDADYVLTYSFFAADPALDIIYEGGTPHGGFGSIDLNDPIFFEDTTGDNCDVEDSSYIPYSNGVGRKYIPFACQLFIDPNNYNGNYDLIETNEILQLNYQNNIGDWYKLRLGFNLEISE